MATGGGTSNITMSSVWDAVTLSISLARTAFAQFSIKLRISLSARAAASGMMRFLISSISTYSIILHAGGFAPKGSA
jgi:hypothetical protein